MPADSLIQQRIAIDRMRIFGAVGTIAGAALLIGGLASAFSSETPSWWLLPVPLFLLAAGVTRLVIARRTRIEFEAEHGRDAGRQEPVR
ncbi:hypothetical protein M2152_002357 [Microbacteriaceae bacterium SG_E_30_P1]|uniref:Uncharacterized protein n=1 Tax=Antiquaquibacter oligotrophicus TaxID=2880260 RepID=A0ABT6KQC3_9MICO|nr:hypothetical protein [Antiquaquibacter oligotrophicus]MDH6182175.1 hypothetical protein [Antiquaquibacter oligotrophicus]UDF12163.1 hypothetical protein LH407_08285 [Antiquaquibacter oligotrophicus]